MEGADCRGEGVVTDGLLTTGKGMGWSLDLGLELVGLLTDRQTAMELKKRYSTRGEIRRFFPCFLK